MLERMRREKVNAGAPEGVVSTPPEIGTAPAPNGYNVVPLYDTDTGREISPDNPTGVPAEVGTVPEQKANGYYQIPVGEEPQKPEGYGDYNWYGDFVGQYMNPLTNEERARRERAAYITSGVQNLGKAFGALGNMFAARNGAPAQQPVKVEDADKRVNAFREYADKERNAYLSAKLQRQKLIDDAYDKDWTRWYNSVKANNSMASTMEALEIKRMKQQIDAHKADLQAQLMAARIRGEEAKAKKLEMELNYVNDIEQGKVDAWEALAYMRNTAAARNKAMEDKHRYETGGTQVKQKMVGNTVVSEERTFREQSNGQNRQGGTTNGNTTRGENSNSAQSGSGQGTKKWDKYKTE